MCLFNWLTVERLGEGLSALPVGVVLLTSLICGTAPGLASVIVNAATLGWIVVDPPGSIYISWPNGYLHEAAFLVVAVLAWRAAVGLRREMINVWERDEAMAAAAHDLRSPLNALSLTMYRLSVIGDAASTVQDRLELQEAIEFADKQIGRTSALIDALFTICRTRGNRAEELDLSQVVREAIEELRSEIERSGCQVQLQTVPVLGCWHRIGLKRVVANLISNAARYAPGTSIRIEVGIESGCAQVEVSDGGPGISPTAIPRMFTPYNRGVAENGRSDGSGLGLYIVRQIVEAHHGTVKAYSPAEGGARFVVRLPMRHPHSRWSLKKRSQLPTSDRLRTRAVERSSERAISS